MRAGFSYLEVFLDSHYKHNASSHANSQVSVRLYA